MIDTLTLARGLVKHGFTREQAEGLAEELKSSIEESTATKSDLNETASGLQRELASLEADVRAWMLAQTILLVGAMVGLKIFI